MADGIGFSGHRTRVWAELRRLYPEKMDPSKLDGERLKDDECPTKFLINFQKKWRDETGSAWNTNDTTKSLFKVMIKKTMPPEVQKRLDNVVGLMKMEWPLFSEHIVHHVENWRKEKKREEEANKNLATKLTQLQLNELTKAKKEKSKTQAPVVTAELSQPTPPVVVAPQAPATTQPMALAQPPQVPPMMTQGGVQPVPPQQGYTPQQGYPQQGYPQQSYQQRGNYQPQGGYPPQGSAGGYNRYQTQQRPRGGPNRRGGWRGPMGPSPMRRTQSNPQLNQPQGALNTCWGCGESGHQRQDCETHPWEGPTYGWQ